MTSYNVIAILESIKLNEKRIPIHPTHFNLIKENKNNICFQHEYAKNFGITDDDFKKYNFKFVSRNELLETADVIFLLKPTQNDLVRMKKGAILIGWCHTVQQSRVAQIAQERKLTLIAMEAMYNNIAGRREHLFYKNNFIAGSVGVEHALSSIPFRYSKDAKVAVITYGAVGHGAVTKFKELGFNNITVFSRRSKSIIEDKIPGINYETLIDDKHELFTSSGEMLKKILLGSDIIVNAIMQDVLHPYQFLSREDLKAVANKYIIDISCDNKMGFDFACPTTIPHPVLKIENNFYYAVENIPAICWQTISSSISEALVPLVKAFSSNQFTRDMHTMLCNATDIKDGKIINQTITEYQKKVSLLTLA